MLGKRLGISICSLPDCRLEVSMHPEGPAIGHLDTAFLVFISLQANAEMVPKITNCYYMLLNSPPDLN
jgi:hypothetical protein